MAVTIDASGGKICAVEDTLANCVLAVSENCASPNDVVAFMYRSSDAYTVVFHKSKK